MKMKQIMFPISVILIIGLGCITMTGMLSLNDKLPILFSGIQTILLVGILVNVMYPNKNKD